MSYDYGHWPRHREGLLNAISVGAFLVLVGIIFVTTPRLFGEATDFFQDFAKSDGSINFVGVPSSSGLNISLPAPRNLATHMTAYRVIQQFSIVWGAIQIIMFVVRSVYQSPISKKSETLSNIIFWLGTAYVIQIMLILPPIASSDYVRWFSFWAAVLIVIGVSLLVRATYLAAMWPLSRRRLYTTPSTTT